jgi:hypothetical protein
VPANLPNDVPPQPQWTLITPAMAKLWLDTRNLHNRTISQPDVDKYARDMVAGRWRPIAKAIEFGRTRDDKIVIVDGQHRLAAIAQAGVPVLMLVAHGIALEDQGTIDTGRPRTFRDQLNLKGEVHYSTLSAALRRVALWEVECYIPQGSGLRPTHSELEDVLKRHPEVRTSTEFGISNHAKVGIHASLLSFVHWLLTTTNPVEGRIFLERLCDGVGLAEGHPILVLRDRIRRENERRQRERRSISPETYIAFIIYAWNGYRTNAKRTKMQLPQGGLSNDNFPRPRR